MADENLVKYIKTQVEAGYELSAIEQMLKRSGYSADLIDDAINSALISKGSKSNKKIWFIGGVVLAVIVLGVAAFFVVSNMNSNPNNHAINDTKNITLVENNTLKTPPPVKTVDYGKQDVEVGPPSTKATYENPVVLPTLAVEIKRNESALYTLSLFMSSSVTSSEPSISCNLLPTDNFIIIPQDKTPVSGEAVDVSFIIKAQKSMLFTECYLSWSTSDGIPLSKTIAVTIL